MSISVSQSMDWAVHQQSRHQLDKPRYMNAPTKRTTEELEGLHPDDYTDEEMGITPQYCEQEYHEQGHCDIMDT